MFKYSVIETPLNKWAVITPMQERTYHTGRVIMPKWLPQGFTHVGIFNTLDEAITRMENLREMENISL
jgi:hypothetical protein